MYVYTQAITARLTELCANPNNARALYKLTANLIVELVKSRAQYILRSGNTGNATQQDIYVAALSNLISSSVQKLGLSITNKINFVWNVIVDISATDPNRYMDTGGAMKKIQDVLAP
eukprot:953935_1